MKIDQGATFRRVFIVEYVAATPTWVLTGYSARMHIRTEIDSDEIVLEATTANGRMTIGPDPNQITLVISATETAALTPGVYVYDLEIESPDNEVIRLIQGRVVVAGEVTR